ncbi:winged helix-turn-helix domain-containing protein [Yinghuangia sp. ASG 101]|uniref:BTAD domain-containing putative transcriptional regulator n=1 Tax=Yinghuangia sp. ASG 101 TaxID=2896848 RepID=UPI001E30FD80|nr:BTAD domain-containing putative transcriptional regulator [Yinghuangia sp. ASG 101]UGQ13094.1 winged helix-turn-helix domain-containing protein [Yinghuangia sp. ASG 101]
MLFGILGPVEARRSDGTAVAVGGPRVRSLLALLLLNAGRVVPTETLVDGLYGDNPPSGAANALQSQVSRLRKALRDGAGTDKLVEFHAAGYRLAVDPERVDAHRFARLAREGRHALTRRDHATAERCLAEALALWRGPAFADIRDAPFASGQADAWAEQRLDAVADRCETRLALGQGSELVGELRRLVTEHPLRERFVGQLMRALYGNGRQAEALAAFDSARTRLADELGADPSAELAAIHVDILRAAPSLATPASPGTAPEPPEHRGLPAPLTSFVGRDDELARIGTLLASARLVTLTGPGGSGKTRLSVEAGRRRPGEVCFVELAAVRRRDELVQTLLSALGLRETGLGPLATGPADATTRLVSGLAARDLLLILDNCEQIVDDVARLAHTILGACPGVRILATSREALGVTGETLCPVPTLAVPDADAPLDVALAAPVIRLFADRAGAVCHDFAIDAGNLAAVRGICSALDGLPLAVELAAARLRTLPLDEIGARLDDRFRLLSRGNRSAAPRHRTLRAVVEWSWELLDASEQELARRLTVFVGGATIEAAARVCGLSDGDAVELLADLADKSLIEGHAGRYRMSETVRLYGSERLEEAGERERFRRAHADYFLDLAQRAEPRLRTGDQLLWLDRLRAEHTNLRAALRWAVTADPALGLRLGAALTWYWWLRGLRREASGPAGELIAAVGDVPPPGMTEEYLLCLLTSLHAELTPGGEPRPELVARAQRLFYTLDETPRQPELFVVLSTATGPLSPAERSRTLLLIGDDPWSQATTRIGYGFVHLYGGELAEAERYFREALTRFQALGDRWGQANCFDQIAVFADWSGDTRGGLLLIDEALELMRQLGITDDIDDLLLRRAEMCVRLGDRDAARATYEQVIASATGSGRPTAVAVGRAGLGDLARREGRIAEAARLQERALAACPSDSFDAAGAHAVILTWLGWTSLALDDAARARALAYAAIDMTYRQANLLTAADGIEVLSAAALHDGEAAEAAVLLGLATKTRGSDVPGRVEVEQVRAAAREALGAEAFETARAQGRAVPRDAVLTHLERHRTVGA